jgi:predicted RNA polymerase sigma factor
MINRRRRDPLAATAEVAWLQPFAMVHGPVAGLALLGTLDADDRPAPTHGLAAVRAHLLEQAGHRQAARESNLHAARMTACRPEQRYLTRRAALLGAIDPPGS